MKFDLSALKAYVGMALATYGAVIAEKLAGFLLSFIGGGTADLKTGVATVIAAILGYVAVYFTPNKQT